MKHTFTGSQTSAPALGLRITLAVAALAALVSVGMVAGCSGDGADNRDSVANSTPASSTTSGGGSVAAMPAVLTSPTVPSSGGHIVALGDSLPPDVNAMVEDSLAAPGQVIAITAQGSDDVSQIGLSDGLGRMQLFTRDPASNAWHVLYRVPLKTTKDRLALSVTALNDVNRWRRVWVFVNVDQPSDADCGEGDDADAQEADTHHE